MTILDRLKNNLLVQIGIILVTCISILYPILSYIHNLKIERLIDNHKIEIAIKDLRITGLENRINTIENESTREAKDFEETSKEFEDTNNQYNSNLTFDTSPTENSKILETNSVFTNNTSNSTIELKSVENCNTIIKLFYSYGDKISRSVVLSSTDKKSMVKIWNQLESDCGENYLRNNLGKSYKNYQIIMKSWEKN